VPPTLDKAVRAMPARFVGQSQYWYNLQPYRELFGDASIFIGFMEELQRDPPTFFAGLCSFLGVATRAPQRPHLNKSEGKVVPTSAYSKVNALPGIGIAKNVLPSNLRHAVKRRVLSRSVDVRPQFSEPTRARLVEALAPDASELLAHCGKPESYWTF
jgi:hypothetical protein